MHAQVKGKTTMPYIRETIDPASVDADARKLTFDNNHGSGASLLERIKCVSPRAEAAIYRYEARVESAARDTRALEILMQEVPA
jgi:hypothetical protein